MSAHSTESILAARARVAGTAGITSAIGAGNILYAASLTKPERGWINDGNQCAFRSHGYHVQTTSAHMYAWCYSYGQEFHNAVISTQARLSRGQVYGLVFRLNPVAQQFYVLEINTNGSYRFVEATGTDPSNWLTLVDWTTSNAILPGLHKTNALLVIASGSAFRFYVNKQLILSKYTNSAYTSGLIGFLVGGDSADGTEAVFNNIAVFQK
jgi:hypothetical protein